MNYQHLQVEVRDAVGTIWLNRPDVRNALDDRMVAELSGALAALAEDPQVRVLVLAGRGLAFCAGGDLNWMKKSADYSEEQNQSDALKLAEMLRALYEIGKPTIARVHGAAFAGGMGLAAACDIVVADPSAEFCLSEVRLGLIPATISPYIVRALGAKAAQRYMLTGERISAQTAHRMGFVNELCQDEPVDAVVALLTRALLAGGPEAIRESKRLVQCVANRDIDSLLAADTARRIAAVRASVEGREGIASFLQKRRPSWALASTARS